VSAKQAVIVAAIASKVPSIPQEELHIVVETIMALHVVRAASDVSVKTFVNDLARAMSGIDGSAPALTSDEMPAFKKKVKTLLEIEGLSLISKAIGLRSDFPDTFCDAKVLTNLRPVFGPDVKVSPLGAVITHTLKIEYHRNSKHREFYLSLDHHDLDKLIAALERAKQKNATLKALLNKAGTPDLEV
jgi:hypothetical protein